MDDIENFAASSIMGSISETTLAEIPMEFGKLKKKKKKLKNIEDFEIFKYVEEESFTEVNLDESSSSFITDITKEIKPTSMEFLEASKTDIEESSVCDAPFLMLHEDCSDPQSEINLSFGKKKKKKKVSFSLENELSVEKEFCPVASSIFDNLKNISELKTTDDFSDYSYDYLITRAFNLIRERNPDVDDFSKKKLVMKPPQVLRVGSKKTSFANFLEICKMVRRIPQHVQYFLLVELGTNGSIDGNGQLVIKGKFQQKQLEHVLRKYIKEYVTCHTCYSPDTILLKEIRLSFLVCEACGSRCSVASIKSGFQAVISKRAAIRAKTN